MSRAVPGPGRTRTSNFRIAFRVLAPERRRAIRALYGFCRQADDAVDEARTQAGARAALDTVRGRLEHCYAGEGADGPPCELGRAVHLFDLPRRAFEELLEGVSWDLEARRYRTREDLRAYCYRVASTVGLLCVRIFGCRDGGCDSYAEELGIALQWTNILRDVRPDLERGRLYLPLESLERHGVTEVDLVEPRGSARGRVDALIRDEAHFARGRFAAATAALPAAQRRTVMAGEIMASVYRLLLGRVERAGAGVLERTITVSSLRRTLLAAKVVLHHRVNEAVGEAGS